jgi:hypothetical protein
MLANFRIPIEYFLMGIMLVSILEAVPKLLMLRQPIDLESQAIEKYTGALHVFYTKGRHSQQRLEVLSPEGKQLASISCDLLVEPCSSLEGQGIATVSTVSSTQGYLIPLKIQRDDKIVIVAEESQLNYLESERISQLDVVIISSSTFIMSMVIWILLRARLWPDAPIL